MEDRSVQAEAYFKEGYNCAQAVALAYADEMGMTHEQIAMLASPFGGGMGRMREVCGAVSGMFLVQGA
ncbi:C-GCAxxG-C-C family protein, partial [Christensenellaceae bacterium OttesenSCG-928-K19]|nr:C-GCAxxG-C-C family protein [Christensenellaceae bacterium OttesenSCG-928-K19]